MKKINLLFLALSTFTFAQVGVDTNTPYATLDVTGKPTDTTKIDGIIAPRISGDNLRLKSAVYGENQKGTIVYVTNADSAPIGSTINVTVTGYYYFDGTTWKPFSSTNSSTTGSSIVKLRLTAAANTNIITTASGYYSFRYNQSTVSGRWQIRNNTSASRNIAVFISEFWTPTGYGSETGSSTVAPGVWVNFPNSTAVNSTNELNIHRIYDLEDGRLVIFEGMLISNNGLKESMTATEY